MVRGECICLSIDCDPSHCFLWHYKGFRREKGLLLLLEPLRGRLLSRVSLPLSSCGCKHLLTAKPVAQILDCALTSSQTHIWALLYFYCVKLTIHAPMFSLTPSLVDNWRAVFVVCCLLSFNPDLILGVSMLKVLCPNS